MLKNLLCYVAAIVAVTVAVCCSNQVTIYSMMCRVRCLTSQKNGEKEMSDVSNSLTMFSCFKLPACEACLRPCSQPAQTMEVCKEDCNKSSDTVACRESCEFMRVVKGIKSGRCPPETLVSGEAATCVKACTNDANCSDMHKCCSNGCGWTCQQPTHIYDGFPDIPNRPEIKERIKASTSSSSSSSSQSSSASSSIELKWNNVMNANSVDLVLYLVESRFNVGQQFDEAQVTNWTQVAQTTGTSTTLDAKAGHWYQYRVTAVNMYGSRGGSEPSQAFALSREPRRPSPPQNLTEGDTFIAGGRVEVSIHWSPPKKSDLPISRYKIFWANRPKKLTPSPLASPSSPPTNHREHRKVVPGDQLYFQIPNLLPDTTYFVQLQAICQYGDMKLKSDRVGIPVITYPLNNILDPSTNQPTNSIRSLPTPASPVDLHVSRPYFHHDSLKANVSWKYVYATDSPPVASVFVDWMPEACIADQSSDDELSKRMSINVKTTSFVIYDLRYDCRYLVELHPMSTHGIQGSITRRTFNTPSCSEAIIVGKHRPGCSNNEDRWSTTPLNLQHSFFISSSNITAKIFWENNQSKQHTSSSSSSSTSSSSSSSSLDNLSSSSSSSLNYRITWNPSGEPSSSITRILPGGTTSHVITDLREGTKYTVKLQRLSRHSSSHPSTIHINTPLLQHKHHQQLFESDSPNELYHYDDDGYALINQQQRQDQQLQQARVDWREPSMWNHRNDDAVVGTSAATSATTRTATTLATRYPFTFMTNFFRHHLYLLLTFILCYFIHLTKQLTF